VEKTVLSDYLAGQRRHVLGAIDGLDDEALHRAVLPSGWNCLGLVRHLALDVDQFWFRAVIAGEPDVIDYTVSRPDDAWKVGPQVPAAEVLDLYRREAGRADTVLAGADLDAAPAWWPDFFGDFRLATVREVVLHVLTEVACHCGHLDAARELIDGKQWIVLTDEDSEDGRVGT
jgi:uncharacterized damage-inducible protein DinB